MWEDDVTKIFVGAATLSIFELVVISTGAYEKISPLQCLVESL